MSKVKIIDKNCEKSIKREREILYLFKFNYKIKI